MEKSDALQEVVAVFDPDTVVSGRADLDIQTLVEQGFVVNKKSKFSLTHAQLVNFSTGGPQQYSKFEGGPIIALILSRNDAFSEVARIGMDNVFFTTDCYTTLRAKMTLFPAPPVLQRTVVLTSDSAAKGQIEQLLKANSFILLWEEERTLDDHQAELLASRGSFVGKPIQLLIVEKLNAVDELQLLVGTSEFANSNKNVWYAPDWATAEEVVKALYPTGLPVTCTFAMIKPDAMRAGNDAAIIEKIVENGFEIVAQKVVRMSKERAREFYSEHEARPFYESLTSFMSSGPITALVLAKAAAVPSWRTLLGPTNSVDARRNAPLSIRAQFGTDGQQNAAHGSDSRESAEREIRFFFPTLAITSVKSLSNEDVQRTILTKDDARSARSSEPKSLNQVLIKGLTELCRTKPVGLDAVEKLAVWLRENNPNKPRIIPPSVPAKILSLKDRLSAVSKGKIQIVFIVAPPGAGKGTQCKKLVERFGYSHISSGDCLRAAVAAGSKNGLLIKDCIAQGQLVPDEIVLELLQEAMEKAGSTRFLLDGFPRKLEQAFQFEETIAPCTRVLHLQVSDDIVTKRLLERGLTSGRADDNETTIRKRLLTYHAESEPVIQHYALFGKVCTINGERPVEEVWKDVARMFA